MIKAPDLDTIYAAELKLDAARECTLDGARRTWLSMKSALVRPSSLALVAAAGFCGGWLVSRRSPTPTQAPDGETQARKGLVAGLVLPFALQAASRLLPQVLGRLFTEAKSEDPCTVVQTTVMHDGSPL